MKLRSLQPAGVRASAPAVSSRRGVLDGSPATPAARRAPLRRAWFAAAVCVVGALVSGAGWALSSPVGSSPDDDYHMVSIWCAAPGDSPTCSRVGETADGEPVVRVPAMLAAGACYAGKSWKSAECQDEVAQMGSVDTDRVNTTDYPGGFYRVMAVFAGDDIATSIVVMRLVNVLLAVVLFAALAASGTAATRRIQLYTLAAVMVPVGWFLVASVNPSGWAVTGVTAFGFGLHSALASRGSRRTANGVLAAVGATMAMSARGDAAVFVVIVATSVCLLHRTRLSRRPRLLVLPVLVSVAATVIALSSPQVAGVAGPEPETSRSAGEVLVSFVLGYPTLLGGIFGYNWGLGWIDTAMPALTVCCAMVVSGFLLLAGLGRTSIDKTLALLVLGAALFAIPFLTLYRARLVIGESVQPRYLLPLIPVLLLVLLTGRRAERGLRLTRSQAVVVWTLLSLANAAALYTNTWRYVTGTDDATLAADAEWWWWTGGLGPIAVWLVASAGFACFAASVIVVSRPHLMKRSNPPPRASATPSQEPPTRRRHTTPAATTKGTP